VSVLYQDSSLRYVWGESIESPLWDTERLVGASDEDIMPAAEAARLRAAKESVLATGESRRLEIQLPHIRGERFFDVWIDADTGEGSGARGIVTTAIEITEQKRREQTLRALLREVSHRSKNLLAIIQSIAMQTSRYSFSIDQFLIRFRGRLQSLASSQDLVTSSNWRGANLHNLIESQVGVYTDPVRGVRVTGDDPYLTPNAALHVGLALHELAVNSVSYGALSLPRGHVDLAAEMLPGPDGRPVLRLVWSENIPSAPAKARERRFWSIALERVVPTSLNGEATLNIGEERLEYRLIVPSENFDAG